jgi:hypothetical protein
MQEGTLSFKQARHEGSDRLSQRQDNQEEEEDLEKSG